MDKSKMIETLRLAELAARDVRLALESDDALSAYARALEAESALGDVAREVRRELHRVLFLSEPET